MILINYRFTLMICLDKEDTLDALIRNVKDQQRESQVVSASVVDVW